MCTRAVIVQLETKKDWYASPLWGTSQAVRLTGWAIYAVEKVKNTYVLR